MPFQNAYDKPTLAFPEGPITFPPSFSNYITNYASSSEWSPWRKGLWSLILYPSHLT